MRQLFGFPDTASGLFVTGTSMANLIGVLVARTRALGVEVRRDGVAAGGKRLVAYTSAGAHGCIRQADGSCRASAAAALHCHSLQRTASNRYRRAQGRDRAGSRRGAYALPRRSARPARSTPAPSTISPRSPIIAGAKRTLVPRRRRHWCARHHGAGHRAAACRHRAGRFHRARFPQMGPGALRRRLHPGARRQRCTATLSLRPRPICAARRAGLPPATPWPCDFGPDLSRGFRALKTWFTLKVYGTEALGAMMSRSCELARYLEIKIATTRELELLAPVAAQHRLLPLSRRRCRSSQRRDRRRPARIRHRRAVDDDDRRPARHPRGDRQPPHRAARHRRHGQGGSALRRGRDRKLRRVRRGGLP